MAIAAPLLVFALGAGLHGAYTYSVLQGADVPLRYVYERQFTESITVALFCVLGGGLAYLVSWTIAWIVTGFKADGR
jgi:hypothetical protein